MLHALWQIAMDNGPRTTDNLLAPLQGLLLRATRNTDLEKKAQPSAVSSLLEISRSFRALRFYEKLQRKGSGILELVDQFHSLFLCC